MEKRTKVVLATAAVAAVAVGAAGYALMFGEGGAEVLRLATTTSTYDSGLLDYVLPEFENAYDCEVDVIAVGSGQALELGKRGDVDVLLVHSPSAEISFMDEGYGESRTLVMYNNFVIVGPVTDPAHVRDSNNVTDAFTRIHDNGTAGAVKFVSRGDNSGTHAKELSSWSAAGLSVSTFSEDWYFSAAQGMGAVLDMCEELDAYTLSDDATYYQRTDEGLVPHLEITYSGDSELFNQYSVIPVNSSKWPHVNRTLAVAFKDWITSWPVQDLIASYEKYGHQLFFPNAPGYAASAYSVPIAGTPFPDASSSASSSSACLGRVLSGAVAFRVGR